MNNSVLSNTDKGNKRQSKQKGCIEKILQRKQKGCGFRLHFCMDNKKKLQIKGGNKRHSTKGVSSQKTITSVTKHDPPLKNPTLSPNPIRSTVNRKNVNSLGNSQSNEVLRSQGKSEDKVKKEPKNPTTRRQSILKGNKKTSSLISLNNSNPEMAQSGQKIQFCSQEDYVDTKELGKVLGIKKVPIEHKRSSLDLQSESATPKDFETFQKSNRQKSSMKRDTFQSFMSLRKRSTLTSSIHGMAISQILSKLCMIEDRITNLEKNCKDQKNIKNIVGVSCKGKNVELKKMDENGQRSKIASSFKSNTTVVIKVWGDDVVEDAGEGNEEKKQQILQGGKSEPLVDKNKQNLNILSNKELPLPNSTQSTATQTIMRVYSQMTGPIEKQRSQSWKKVSQELKLLPLRN